MYPSHVQPNVKQNSFMLPPSPWSWSPCRKLVRNLHHSSSSSSDVEEEGEDEIEWSRRFVRKDSMVVGHSHGVSRKREVSLTIVSTPRDRRPTPIRSKSNPSSTILTGSTSPYSRRPSYPQPRCPSQTSWSLSSLPPSSHPPLLFRTTTIFVNVIITIVITAKRRRWGADCCICHHSQGGSHNASYRHRNSSYLSSSTWYSRIRFLLFPILPLA